jgi:PAS domain S-box-containing protein
MEEPQMEPEQLLAEVKCLRRRLADLEAQHQDSQAMLQALVGSIPDIIYRLDRDGRILYISDAVRRYGYEPQQLVGTSIMELIHSDDRGQAKYRVDERRTGERRTRSHQLRLVTPEHAQVTFEFVGSAPGPDEVPLTLSVTAEGLYGSGQPTSDTFLGTQGVARDITDRLRAEKALLEAESLRVFTATAGAAAHEINQPLTVLVGSLELMLQRPDGSPASNEEYEELLEAAQRISSIVNNMRKAQHYVTKRYVKDSEIADFDASSAD